jgi:hypothetical protein
MNAQSGSHRQWENLQVLAVQSVTGTLQLYANARQQAPLLVKIQAVDINGEAVPLSHAELMSLKLIHHAGNKPVLNEFLQSGPMGRDEWRWSSVHNSDFKPFPAGNGVRPAPIDQGGPAEHIHYRYLYVRTNSLTPLRIALELKRDDGKVFRSNDPEMENGSLTLESLAPRVYPASAYSFDRVVIKGDPDSKSNFDGVDYYPLSLNDGGVNIEFDSFTFSITPRSIFRLDIAPRDRGSFTGYTRPGNPYFIYGGYSPEAPEMVEAKFRKPGGVVIVHVRQKKIAASTSRGASMGPAVIKTLDMYGNEHTINLRFKGNDRKYLELF